MIPKGEVNYIKPKEKRNLYILFILSIIFIIAITTAVFIKLYINLIELYTENQELNKVIEMKNSQIADLEENLKDLFIENQNLKFGGN